MANLTLKQKLFCQYYLENSGNGTNAVIKAGYRVNKNGKLNRNLAKSIASENLTKPDIRKYIEELLKATGFNKESVKLQHLSLISQSENLPVKAKAIDMFYKLTGDYAATKIEERNPDLQAVITHIRKILPTAGQ